MSLATHINTALSHADAYAEAIEKARTCPEIKGKSREEVRAALLPIVAANRGCPLVDGERKAKGTKVLDRSHANYGKTDKAIQRLTADICGVGVPRNEAGLSVPRHIAALAAQLAEACNEYEEAKRLASTAIAAAFAK